jgi:hypothetical protein
METKLKRWRNSEIINKEEVNKLNIEENVIKKKNNLGELFGFCKFKRPIKEIIKDIKKI